MESVCNNHPCIGTMLSGCCLLVEVTVYSPVYTGPPEVDLNPDSRPRSAGGLSYPDCNLDRCVYTELIPEPVLEK